MTKVNLAEERQAEVQRLNANVETAVVDLESLMSSDRSGLGTVTVPIWPPAKLSGVFRKSARQKRAASVLRDEIKSISHAASRGTPEAIARFAHLVIERDELPSGFPNVARTAYTEGSKQIAVEYDLPDASVVPHVLRYTYVKTRNEIASVARPAPQIRNAYTYAVARTTLRVLRRLFDASAEMAVDSIAFNGHVHTVDLTTGHDAHPCVVSVRVARSTFEALDLDRVDPVACLKSLGASVSSSPTQLTPVRPLLDFAMVDPRFVESHDVLSELDSRPNLMDLSPNEFENLITNLFEKMGLETRQTQASRDGGVDCVAYNNDPVLGGKVVIQAKRYRHTVGVSAVRDLYGTVQNEGASKGILVTTSGYGPTAYEFVKNKPLELFEGTHLLYLLSTHAGIHARIEMPEEP